MLKSGAKTQLMAATLKVFTIGLLFAGLSGAALSFSSCAPTASSGETVIKVGLGLPPAGSPITSAAPAGFMSGSSAALSGDFSRLGDFGLWGPVSRANTTVQSSDIKSLFFTKGTTDILTVLAAVDKLIEAINAATALTVPSCAAATPVSYTVTPFGQTITMYATCYTTLTAVGSNDPALFQFGTQAGVTYYYIANGDNRAAIVVTPVTGATGKYSVQVWMGIGYVNPVTIDSAAYGAYEIAGNSNTNAFEMAVAGVNMGYCGMQVISDGSNIYATGSVDSSGTCQSISTLCVAAADATTAGSCTSTLEAFTLTPIGRAALAESSVATQNWAVSPYPTTPNITLTGVSTTDSIYFGPTAPTATVGQYVLPTSQ